MRHGDSFGPTRTVPYCRHTYILPCYDDHTHRIQLYFCDKKSDAASAFKQYLNLVKNQCGSTVKRFRSDNAGEFTSRLFLDLLAAEGVVPRKIPPAAHAQNGRIERVHRTILDTVRIILVETGLPKAFWAEITSYAAYVAIAFREKMRERPHRKCGLHDRVQGCKSGHSVRPSTYRTIK